MRHTGTPELETDRLLLRRLLPQDAPQMYENWANDPAVTRFCAGNRTKALPRPGTAFGVGRAVSEPRLLPVGHGGKGHRTGVWLHLRIQRPAG